MRVVEVPGAVGEGALRVASAEGNVLTLISSAGTKLVLDVDKVIASN